MRTSSRPEIDPDAGRFERPRDPSADRADGWSRRWQGLARGAGIAPDEPLLVALSGGADSVLLLRLIAACEPRPPVRSLHVDHGLRGAESDADARFAAHLADSLGVPHRTVRIPLDPSLPSLEARARELRYAVLCAEAERTDHRTIVTGHHADDGLETLLLRWMRGTDPAGLPGPWPEERRTGPAGAALRIVRPLLPLRREEVRLLLAERGLSWREDGSNGDPAFTRNRIRARLLPDLARAGGPSTLAGLHRFARAVEALETRFAARTVALAWRPGPWFPASRRPAEESLGGLLERAALDALPRALQRRALWRLLTEGVGRAPRRPLLDAILDDLANGRIGRHALPRGWSLVLRAETLVLLPPGVRPPWKERLAPAGDRRAQLLPFPPSDAPAATAHLLRERLPVPGVVTLADGRRLSAERVDASAALARGPLRVDLDAHGLPDELEVRVPRPGERFHGLGAPGSRRLVRFLADRGVPREERGNTLVVATSQEDRILWVVGQGPCERHRVRPTTQTRLRLILHR